LPPEGGTSLSRQMFPSVLQFLSRIPEDGTNDFLCGARMLRFKEKCGTERFEVRDVEGRLQRPQHG
jgi:hypothetical protein